MIIKNDKWKVYYHQFPDDTIYIGITSRNLKDRWKKDGKGYKGQAIYEIIQQYDWNTEVEHILFADNLTLDEASNIEKLLIKTMREISPYTVRYNIADGGFNCQIQKNKKVYQYDLEGNFIAEYPSMTDAANNTIGYNRISQISIVCNKVPRCYTAGGFQWSFEKYEKIPSLKYPDRGIPVDQFDLNGNYIRTFKNATQAANELKLENHICDCCKGARRLCGPYQWKYHEETPYCEPIKRKKSARIIDQYDLNDNYITTWIGLEDLQTFFQLNNKPSHILDVCNGKRKTAYGYKWKFNPQDTIKKYNYQQSVLQYDLNNTLIKKYSDILIAAKENPGTRKDHIIECCEGKAKTHKGYKWQYAENQ